MQTDLPPGINYERVSRFFAENVPGADTELHFTLLSGGRSNLTYLVSAGDRVWVMRRPPLGHVLPTAHDMYREYRVLTGLNETPVPAPRTYAYCDDPEVNEYPFYVMDYHEGAVIGESIPEGFAETPEDRRAISQAMIDALVQLHAVDYEAVGLGDFGRPQGYLERQVRRWSEQWERNKTRELPEIDGLIDRLRNAVPESPAPTIVHGDYRLGNIMINRDDPSHIEAILDWEMATLGDPLADLGYTFIFWGQADDPPERLEARDIAGITAKEGFMTRQELADEYSRLSGRSTENIGFYEVLAYFKLAVITEGIWSRYLQGATVGEGYEGYGETTVRLVHQALRAADESPL
ncbi:MAG: phosphotransferase family protein [Dehalococcoidia bacterium]|nr:phosphotransferase family protein [Dehalococcoidia bacterium]